MKNRNFIVTGASQGLGAALCKQLSLLGHRVLATARSETNLAQLWQDDPNVDWVALDLSKPDSAEKLIQHAVDKLQTIHGVVNNAGTIEPIAPLAASDPEAWTRAIQLNLTTPAMIMRAALPHLQETEGVVLNISTGAAVKVVQGWSAYCASKAGLLHLTSVAAVENPKLRFYSLRPGVIDTAMQNEIRNSSGMTEADKSKFQALKQNDQLEPPEVPARSAVWLLLQGPKQRSGEFIQYTDEEVVRRVERLFDLELL